jgi:hypothetical protein
MALRRNDAPHGETSIHYRGGPACHLEKETNLPLRTRDVRGGAGQADWPLRKHCRGMNGQTEAQQTVPRPVRDHPSNRGRPSATWQMPPAPGHHGAHQLARGTNVLRGAEDVWTEGLLPSPGARTALRSDSAAPTKSLWPTGQISGPVGKNGTSVAARPGPPSKRPALPDPLMGRCKPTNLAKDRADAQRLVATRLLDRLHDPLGHFSRLQRIHPRAR